MPRIRPQDYEFHGLAGKSSLEMSPPHRGLKVYPDSKACLGTVSLHYDESAPALRESPAGDRANATSRAFPMPTQADLRRHMLNEKRSKSTSASSHASGKRADQDEEHRSKRIYNHVFVSEVGPVVHPDSGGSQFARHGDHPECIESFQKLYGSARGKSSAIYAGSVHSGKRTFFPEERSGGSHHNHRTSINQLEGETGSAREKTKRRVWEPVPCDPPLPTLFVSHGPGPFALLWNEDLPVVRNFAALAEKLRFNPRLVSAIVVISAHWESSDGIEVSIAEPSFKGDRLFYDYTGAPQELYELENRFRPPGSRELSLHIVELLRSNGFDAKVNMARKLDQGVFVPLILMKGIGDRSLPVVQVSLPMLVGGANPSRQVPEQARAARAQQARKAGQPMSHESDYMAHHCLELGKALAPLRSQSVLLIGSGQATNGNNLTPQQIDGFVNALKDQCVKTTGPERWRSLECWASLPHARAVHTREDHLLPLHVVAGAAEHPEDTCEVLGDFRVGGMGITHFSFGLARQIQASARSAGERLSHEHPRRSVSTSALRHKAGDDQRR